ncbi:hypothetical protein [Paenibacillus solani]|uniref:Uncharacterized protein n=1 Tax=Paenibacillus solani TaxID=1705565 RepID=A0A0M1P224_9BACL|nr:hypothetical protein [Paenibacillus solani]KOR88124.1 hypothetical protein AM231_02510 [Paenibacillus solani]
MSISLSVRSHRPSSRVARKKPSSKIRRGLKSSGSKRRHGKIGKRHRAGGRYSSRPGVGGSRPLSQVHDKGDDHSYMEDFKAGFAKGYEDGRQADASA